MRPSWSRFNRTRTRAFDSLHKSCDGETAGHRTKKNGSTEKPAGLEVPALQSSLHEGWFETTFEARQMWTILHCLAAPIRARPLQTLRQELSQYELLAGPCIDGASDGIRQIPRFDDTSPSALSQTTQLRSERWRSRPSSSGELGARFFTCAQRRAPIIRKRMARRSPPPRRNRQPRLGRRSRQSAAGLAERNEAEDGRGCKWQVTTVAADLRAGLAR